MTKEPLNDNDFLPIKVFLNHLPMGRYHAYELFDRNEIKKLENKGKIWLDPYSSQYYKTQVTNNKKKSKKLQNLE